ncbi:MAG: protein kinase, partial [Planctomycetota bacterium]|nr:protein kinase [Planctomycetota bacterium]
MIDPADLPPTEPEIPHPGESINPEDATYVPGEVSFADSEPQPGETLRYVGDYEVIGEIARGGMGVVYKARQVTLNRVVALKMLLSGQLAGPDDIARFQTEAQAAAQLDHPGIVPVFEIGRHQSFHYIAMAYIDGRSLAAQVAQGPMQPRDAAELVKTIANAVQYAHERGVIHRDLKPANILIDSAGRPRVTDFGLAKLNQNSSDLTGTGQVLGTPSYMPPEQASGDLKSIAVTADVYSLGAILYCLLVGRPPFQAATIHDTLSQVITQEPVPPRQLNWLVPRDLQTIVLKCLEKHPARRYSTAADLVADLDRFLKGDPILARPVSFAGRMVRQLVKHHKVVAAMVVPVVTLLGAILAYLGYHRWQRCWLTVSGSGMAEIYQNGGTSAVAKFSLPVVEEIAIPSGEYRIRYFGSQEPDETFLLTLRRGVHHAISPPKRERDATSLSLRQREILPKPDPFAAKSDARRVMMSADGMELERWHRLPWTEGSATLLYTSQRASLVVPKRGDSSWDVPFSIPETQNCEVSPHKIGDLTGDGLPDCFFVGTNNSEVFAFLVSGADGQLVWKSTALKLGGQWHGDVICHDLNADGHADALLWIPPSDAVNDVVDDTFVPNCTLVAISGVDGAVLWRHEDAEGAAPVFTKTALGTEIAVATADKVLFLSPA